MTAEQLDPPPFKVHITGSDVPPPRQPEIHLTTRTIVLTAAGKNYADLAPADPARDYMLLQVFGNSAVLCTDISEAQDPANAVAGLPNPNGALLTTGVVIPIRATNRLWIAAAAFPTLISVITAHRGG